MNDRQDLLALGFVADQNGALCARNASVTLTPDGHSIG
jgi:hypothetical protein